MHHVVELAVVEPQPAAKLEQFRRRRDLPVVDLRRDAHRMAPRSDAHAGVSIAEEVEEPYVVEAVLALGHEPLDYEVGGNGKTARELGGGGRGGGGGGAPQ